MTLYKCKDCTHEEDYRYKPSECFICGGSRLILIEKGKGEIMAVDRDIFSSSRFRTTIQGYCNQAGWKINDINDSRAILRFDMESGSVQTLFIIRYDNTLEFSCPSGIKFDDIDDLPHWLSTYLMQKNAEYKIGFWCIEKIGAKFVFSMMHNAEITLIEPKYFVKVVLKLIQDCDDFEKAVEAMLNS
jgi:DNA-directed RNA polymerase subunit RPC12/RpoP